MDNNQLFKKKKLHHNLLNIAKLISQYYTLKPEFNNYTQTIKFGTSGHRGSSSKRTFNEFHILSISQAISEYRLYHKIDGPCYIGKDTHALSEPAYISVIDVLTANNIDVIVQKEDGYTPTPAISYSIISHNQKNTKKSDGIILTSSHNPPEDGGIKYNIFHGGPANINVTKIIENRANVLLHNNLDNIKRCSINSLLEKGCIYKKNLMEKYVSNIIDVIDIQSIKKSKLKLAVDPLGGAGISYWKNIVKEYKIDLTLINDEVDQTFRFIPNDENGIIRMDCSSVSSLSRLLLVSKKFDLSFANDPDHDRHSIITPYGLMNSNHYLSVAIHYLFTYRLKWEKSLEIGKTIVSSTMIDRIAKYLNRKLIEVPVGFKWFSDGLFKGKIGFAGEESSGATFLKFNGLPWSTDKDGIIMNLLSAEITAVTGKNPQKYYHELTKIFGAPSYLRLQIPVNAVQKTILSTLIPEQFKLKKLAGDQIIEKVTVASGNEMPINGIKIITHNGWFAVRPSGTEEIYKIYCESFLGKKHLKQIKIESINFIKSVLEEY